MTMTEPDSWTLADDDFRSFIARLSPSGNHIWHDHPTPDPAMRALETERALRRAATKLQALDKEWPGERLAIAAQQLRFIADRLVNLEGIDTQDAIIWLDAARKLIRLVEGGSANEI
jgi:hypothetical protein